MTTSPPAAAPVIHVIDDDASVRTAIEDLLASVGLHAMLFPSTEAFLRAVRPDAPGCLVLDVRMPGMSGLDFQDEMARRGMDLPVVFMTGHGDIAMSVRAMRAGAVDFLTKPFRDQDLLDAIHRALALDHARRDARQRQADLARRRDSLAEGERLVMDLVVRGLLNKQIAAELGVSEVTVKVRRGNVMRKMGAASLADLVRMAGALQG